MGRTLPTLMRALRVSTADDPANLRVQLVAVPPPGTDQVLIQVLSAAVNRSDMLACRGILPGPFPRTLGRDFAGVVVAGRPELHGTRVWGSGGGDLGMSLDGSHAEYLLAPADGVTRIPDVFTDDQAAASGLAYFTAAAALARAGGTQPGRPAVVTGAAGGVGGAAAALAAWQGARVVGVVKDEREAAAVVAAHFTVVLAADADDFDERLKAAAADACVAVDVVGGSMLEHLLPVLGVGGGLCIVSATPAAPRATVDTLHFYRQELRLVGLHTGRLTCRDSAAILASLHDGFTSGALTPSAIYGGYDLEDAAAAYIDVEKGVPGRPILHPQTT